MPVDDDRIERIRELLSQAVVIPAERLQQVLDDARRRGHIDAKGAEDIANGLARSAMDVRSELEALLGRGRTSVEDVVALATSSARAARTKASAAGEPFLRQVDRARRRAGLPPSFPILNYDDLRVPQVTERLGDLTPEELRAVREHEAAHRARTSVLRAIDKRLAPRRAP